MFSKITLSTKLFLMTQNLRSVWLRSKWGSGLFARLLHGHTLIYIFPENPLFWVQCTPKWIFIAWNQNSFSLYHFICLYYSIRIVRKYKNIFLNTISLKHWGDKFNYVIGWLKDKQPRYSTNGWNKGSGKM